MGAKLSDAEKKEAEEVLINYKRAYACKKCGVIYGSDLTEENSICPRCNDKSKKKVEK